MIKKLFSILFFLSFALTVKSQSQAELQKMIQQSEARMKALKSNPEIAAKMQMAKHLVDSLNNNSAFQKKMNGQQTLLDSLKKKYPEMANYNLPELGKIKTPTMPDLDSLKLQLDQSGKRLASLNNAIDQTTPKQNLFHHAEKLEKLSQNKILDITQELQDIASKNINNLLLGSLKKMTKDTNNNVATTGAFILASGGDENVAVFLISSRLLQKPADEWAANDLGVYFRDMKDLEKSLQFYFYANSLDTGRNTSINTNIGWASAYYGDFETAQKYFDKALAIDTDFQGANEGKAILAYAKGDIAALFQCLSKEIKYIGGSGGPSTSFTKIACKKAAENMNKNTDKDPTQDHTFDNNLPDEAPNTPPGADVDDVTLSQFKKIFVNKPEEITIAAGIGQKQLLQVHKQLMQESKALIAQLSTLKPLGQKPYIDEEGYVIYPSNFEKYVIPLTPIRTSLDNRLAWWRMKFYEKLKSFETDVYLHDQDLIHNYFAELGKCPVPDENDACQKRVSCKWIPIIYKSKNSDLEALGRLWDDYYNHVFNAVDWYLKATAPFISRIHEEGWNNYLNAYRKYKVKVAYYEIYAAWTAGLISIGTDFSASISPEQIITCNAGHNATPKDAPDPFSKKPKHIKEFEGPCFDVKFGCQFGAIHSTCHEDGVKFGNDNLNMSFSHTTDQIAAENQGFTNDVNLAASVEKEFKLGSINKKDVSIKGGVEGNIDMRFDNNWNFKNGKSTIGASADIGNLHLVGVEASRSAELISTQLNVSPLTVITSGPSLK